MTPDQPEIVQAKEGETVEKIVKWLRTLKSRTQGINERFWYDFIAKCIEAGDWRQHEGSEQHGG